MCVCVCVCVYARAHADHIIIMLDVHDIAEECCLLVSITGICRNAIRIILIVSILFSQILIVPIAEVIGISEQIRNHKLDYPS